MFILQINPLIYGLLEKIIYKLNRLCLDKTTIKSIIYTRIQS
jgi:hypothetical protein